MQTSTPGGTKRDEALPLRKKLLFLFLVLLGVGGLLELGFRLFWERPPRFLAARLRDTELFVRDPDLGWRMQPNQSISFRWYWGDTTRITTNSAGYRDREHSKERDTGRKRILVLGDSHAFGYGVDDHEVLAEQLRGLWPDAEVLNLAVTAYNVAQSRAALEIDGLAYRPDVVVLAFVQNDVERQQIPTGSRAAAPPEKPGVKAFLNEHSRFYAFLRSRVDGNKRLARFLVRLGIKDGLAGFDGLDTNLRPSLRVYPAELARAWDETLGEIARLHALCEGAGARLVVLAVPAKESVEPDALPVALSRVDYDPEDFDLDKPYRALAEFCEARGIPFVNPVPRLRESYEAGVSPYFEHDLHINREGHRVLAECLLSALEPGLR